MFQRYFRSLTIHIESVEVLLRAGADVTVEDNQKCTALHLASRKPEFGGPQCVKVLLEHSCNTVHHVDSLGNTALHFAGVFSGLGTFCCTRTSLTD